MPKTRDQRNKKKVLPQRFASILVWSDFRHSNQSSKRRVRKGLASTKLRAQCHFPFSPSDTLLKCVLHMEHSGQPTRTHTHFLRTFASVDRLWHGFGFMRAYGTLRMLCSSVLWRVALSHNPLQSICRVVVVVVDVAKVKSVGLLCARACVVCLCLCICLEKVIGPSVCLCVWIPYIIAPVWPIAQYVHVFVVDMALLWARVPIRQIRVPPPRRWHPNFSDKPL